MQPYFDCIRDFWQREKRQVVIGIAVVLTDYSNALTRK